ncbi:glycine zipper family protein [Ewingella americana]|uniref:Glycine zipper family protein n=1 Tax=Ewingella americana TaxID=41202 RepID=A0A502G9E8_9GAMM|nr:glycine zipper family protein [Ewingella americana]TPG58394.1 glycine zipper family protein [Ewingella americana]
MKRFYQMAPLALLAALSGCVSPPSSPDVTVLPGSSKSYGQFRQDDILCRNSAQDSVSGGAQAASNNAAGTAAAGTVVGAAAGALLGAASGHAGPGALIGAGSGLLVGSAMGSNTAGMSSGDLQNQYDVVYTQCMYAKGNKIPAAYAYDQQSESRQSDVPPDYQPAYPQSDVPPDYHGGSPDGDAPPDYQ